MIKYVVAICLVGCAIAAFPQVPVQNLEVGAKPVVAISVEELQANLSSLWTLVNSIETSLKHQADILFGKLPVGAPYGFLPHHGFPAQPIVGGEHDFIHRQAPEQLPQNATEEGSGDVQAAVNTTEVPTNLPTPPYFDLNGRRYFLGALEPQHNHASPAAAESAQAEQTQVLTAKNEVTPNQENEANPQEVPNPSFPQGYAGAYPYPYWPSFGYSHQFYGRPLFTQGKQQGGVEAKKEPVEAEAQEQGEVQGVNHKYYGLGHGYAHGQYYGHGYGHGHNYGNGFAEGHQQQGEGQKPAVEGENQQQGEASPRHFYGYHQGSQNRGAVGQGEGQGLGHANGEGEANGYFHGQGENNGHGYYGPGGSYGGYGHYYPRRGGYRPHYYGFPRGAEEREAGEFGEAQEFEQEYEQGNTGEYRY